MSKASEREIKQQEIDKLRQVVEDLSTQVASLVSPTNVNNSKNYVNCFRYSKVGHYARDCNNYRSNFNNRGFGNK